MAKQKDETAAVTPEQFNQVLDMLAEQQEEIQRLRQAQAGASATTVQQQDRTAELDAELDALLAEHKDYPGIAVFQRRALEGAHASPDIRLKGEPPLGEDPQGEQRYWLCRWFNMSIEGRAHRALAEGYVKVEWQELQDEESIVGGVRSDPYVRKGERGLEVLYKIPRKLYAYKKRRDMLQRQGLLTSESRLRDYLSDRVGVEASKAGDNADQAASAAHGFGLTITEGKKETVTL